MAGTESSGVEGIPEGSVARVEVGAEAAAGHRCGSRWAVEGNLGGVVGSAV